MQWIPRPQAQSAVLQSLKRYPVTVLLGPRQCGKTTLARHILFKAPITRFDLEDPETPLKPESASLILRGLKGLVVIDECQRQPKLFELLRALSDRRPLPARFLLLGSASMEMVRGISESLAGRAAYVEMGGLSLEEVGKGKADKLWVRGAFPNAFLSPSDEESHRWRMHFIQSFLERDLPQLGIRIPSAALRRFWTMLAHLHGQVWNAADLARSMGVQEDTARRYLDVLTGSFMIRQLQPWFVNTGKRLVKAPKVYFRDSGLLHSLLGLKNLPQIQAHPKLGFSWEGFALEEVIRMTSADRDAFFYKTHSGAELDLLISRGGKSYGFEFKYGDAPQATKSMRVVTQDLKLKQLWVIYPGRRAYPLAEKIEALPLTAVPDIIRRILF